mmetsp:Transcript_607/g.1321  ORF Transcript_607/g.1321 Transcript_607/m.1321 type:complete len:148 (+) Transcript_607:148-591(+)
MCTHVTKVANEAAAQGDGPQRLELAAEHARVPLGRGGADEGAGGSTQLERYCYLELVNKGELRSQAVAKLFLSALLVERKVQEAKRGQGLERRKLQALRVWAQKVSRSIEGYQSAQSANLRREHVEPIAAEVQCFELRHGLKPRELH